MVSNDSEFSHSAWLVWLATVALLIGSGFLFLAYVSETNNWPSWVVFFLSNLGILFVFGAGYTLVSEYFLKKNFAKQVRVSIDKKLEQIRLSENIRNLGLIGAHEQFNDSQLWSRIKDADSVVMVVMRSKTFFMTYNNHIRNAIIDQNKKFTFIILNPEGDTIPVVLKKFTGDTEETLRKSIKDSIDIWLTQQIYRKLPPEKKANMHIRVFDEIPVNSAYLFDDNEIWYIPLHYRHDRQIIPVFIFKAEKDLRFTEIYQDLEKLSCEPLSKEVTLEES